MYENGKYLNFCRKLIPVLCAQVQSTCQPSFHEKAFCFSFGNAPFFPSTWNQSSVARENITKMFKTKVYGQLQSTPQLLRKSYQDNTCSLDRFVNSCQSDSLMCLTGRSCSSIRDLSLEPKTAYKNHSYP